MQTSRIGPSMYSLPICTPSRELLTRIDVATGSGFILNSAVQNPDYGLALSTRIFRLPSPLHGTTTS
jgi:hypothetical protein